MFPLKDWIERKQKNYQFAVDEYIFRIRSAFKRDLEKKIKNLESRSIIISIDDKDCSQKLIQGLAIDKNSLLEANINEKILLFDVKTNKQVATGFIVDVGQQIVKIKLNNQLDLNNLNLDEGDREKGEVVVEEEEQGENKEIVDNNQARKFKIIFDNKEILDRIEKTQYALNKFKNGNCSLTIQKYLLGYYNEKSNSLYNRARIIKLQELNPPLKGNQLKAIENSMKKRISLIEGLPSSGKTLVAANIACSLVLLRKRKILLCSPKQETVDKLARLIEQINSIMIVQLQPNNETNSKSVKNFNDFNCKDSIVSNKSECFLNSMVEDAIYKRGWERSKRKSDQFNDIKKKIRSQNQANRAVLNCSKWLKQKIERDLLKRADIVCCTLLQAATLRGNYRFNTLIIDDCHLVDCESDLLIPMMIKEINQITLISEMKRQINGRKSQQDTRSLRGNSLPRRNKQTIKTRRASEKVITTALINQKRFSDEVSLFERLLLMGICAVPLKHQFNINSENCQNINTIKPSTSCNNND